MLNLSTCVADTALAQSGALFKYVNDTGSDSVVLNIIKLNPSFWFCTGNLQLQKRLQRQLKSDYHEALQFKKFQCEVKKKKILSQVMLK